MCKFISALIDLQNTHYWKFSLAQKAIGGESAVTASFLLAKSRLDERLLTVLLDEFVCVIRNLQKLTHADEVDATNAVKQEFELIREHDKLNPAEKFSAADVSDDADKFVGLSIKKNFHPTKGRFRKLLSIGVRFR